MPQLELFHIPSPCIGVCELNSKGYCKGCFRSREERLYWLQLSDERKRDVLRLCQARKARVQKAREDTQARADDPVPFDQPDLF
jgi:predicted Fe-S protein YdhL (DUF1289 family)